MADKPREETTPMGLAGVPPEHWDKPLVEGIEGELTFAKAMEAAKYGIRGARISPEIASVLLDVEQQQRLLAGDIEGYNKTLEAQKLEQQVGFYKAAGRFSGWEPIDPNNPEQLAAAQEKARQAGSPDVSTIGAGAERSEAIREDLLAREREYSEREARKLEAEVKELERETEERKAKITEISEPEKFPPAGPPTTPSKRREREGMELKMPEN